MARSMGVKSRRRVAACLKKWDDRYHKVHHKRGDEKPHGVEYFDEALKRCGVVSVNTRPRPNRRRRRA